MGSQQSNGYVLHSRRFRENSRIVELFTQDIGRVSVIARVSGKRVSGLLSSIQVFNFCCFIWQGKGDLKYLRSAELLQPGRLTGEAGVCGLYCNELLLYLMPKYEAHPALFSHYRNTLLRLEKADAFHAILRHFEVELLGQLGYGLSFEMDCITQEPLDFQGLFHFHPQQGVSKKPLPGESVEVTGTALQHLHQRNFSQDSTAREIKFILAYAISNLLDGRPLKSRELIRAIRKYES